MNQDTRQTLSRTATSLALVVLTAGAVSACGSATDADPQSRTFELKGASLAIDTDNAAIELISADVDELEVIRWFAGDDDQGIWRLDGSTLILDSSCGWLRNCDVRYAITVPADVGVSLDGENTTVEARGFSRPLAIRTQNGNITVTDTTGDLDLHTDNGSQDVSASTPARLGSRTNNGAIDIDLDQAPMEVDVAADNGRVEITIPSEPAYDIVVSTDRGHVDNDLRTDPDSPHRIRVETDNGEVILRGT